MELTNSMATNILKKIPESEFHQSMRGYFAGYLYNAMLKDEKIITITCDLGWGMFDKIRNDFPDRFINVGASEFAGMGVAVGMALEGKKVFIYSITTFLLYRAFEMIRNYISHERIPVFLIGGGRNKDYAHDGFSHWSDDAPQFLQRFPLILKRFPETNEELKRNMEEMIVSSQPYFLSLRR